MGSVPGMCWATRCSDFELAWAANSMLGMLGLAGARAGGPRLEIGPGAARSMRSRAKESW